MGEFFKGWRRKAGCVTLVMACVLMAGWIRSRDRFDSLTISTGSTSFAVVLSYKGRIYWFSYFQCDPNYLEGMEWGWESDDASNDAHFDERIRSDATYSTFWGVESAQNHKPIKYKINVRSVPYLYFAFPLTLLSAWLMLSKQPSTRTTSEPPKDEP